MGDRIKNPHSPNKGKNISFPEKDWVEGIEHPVFCFKYMDSQYNLTPCTHDELISFIQRLGLLSAMTWQAIIQAPRHGLGTEKIKRSSIKRPIPKFFTEDVDYLLALRFDGKKPFLGHRNRFIFHIVFIDRDFTLYKHS